MSKKLALSSALSVALMAAFALFGQHAVSNQAVTVAVPAIAH